MDRKKKGCKRPTVYQSPGNKLNKEEEFDISKVDDKTRERLDHIFTRFTGEDLRKHLTQTFPTIHPSLLAALIGNGAVMKQLLHKRRDINSIRQPKTENGLLHLMVKANDPDSVRFLLERGADPAPVNCNGDTPFMVGILSKSDKALQVLLKRRESFNLNHANKNGFTALHYAVKKSWKSCVNMLLREGVNTNAISKNGATPLMIAAVWNDVEMAKLLVDKGACIPLENNEICSSICLAVEHEKGDLAKFLVERLTRQTHDEYVKRRVELLTLFPDDHESYQFFEEFLYPVFGFLATRHESRCILYQENLMSDILKTVKKHISYEDITQESLICIVQLLCCREDDSDEADQRFVQQFLKSDGPELMVKIMQHYKESGSSEMVSCAMAPLLPVFETEGGLVWLEKEYGKLVEFIDIVRSYQSTITTENTNLKQSIDIMCDKFEKVFSKIKDLQAKAIGLELLAKEHEEKERQRLKRERKREKKRQKRLETSKSNDNPITSSEISKKILTVMNSSKDIRMHDGASLHCSQASLDQTPSSSTKTSSVWQVPVSTSDDKQGNPQQQQWPELITTSKEDSFTVVLPKKAKKEMKRLKQQEQVTAPVVPPLMKPEKVDIIPERTEIVEITDQASQQRLVEALTVKDPLVKQNRSKNKNQKEELTNDTKATVQAPSMASILQQCQQMKQQSQQQLQQQRKLHQQQKQQQQLQQEQPLQQHQQNVPQQKQLQQQHLSQTKKQDKDKHSELQRTQYDSSDDEMDSIWSIKPKKTDYEKKVSALLKEHQFELIRCATIAPCINVDCDDYNAFCSPSLNNMLTFAPCSSGKRKHRRTQSEPSTLHFTNDGHEQLHLSCDEVSGPKIKLDTMLLDEVRSLFVKQKLHPHHLLKDYSLNDTNFKANVAQELGAGATFNDEDETFEPNDLQCDSQENSPNKKSSKRRRAKHHKRQTTTISLSEFLSTDTDHPNTQLAANESELFEFEQSAIIGESADQSPDSAQKVSQYDLKECATVQMSDSDKSDRIDVDIHLEDEPTPHITTGRTPNKKDEEPTILPEEDLSNAVEYEKTHLKTTNTIVTQNNLDSDSTKSNAIRSTIGSSLGIKQLDGEVQEDAIDQPITYDMITPQKVAGIVSENDELMIAGAYTCKELEGFIDSNSFSDFIGFMPSFHNSIPGLSSILENLEDKQQVCVSNDEVPKLNSTIPEQMEKKSEQGRAGSPDEDGGQDDTKVHLNVENTPAKVSTAFSTSSPLCSTSKLFEPLVPLWSPRDEQTGTKPTLSTSFSLPPSEPVEFSTLSPDNYQCGFYQNHKRFAMGQYRRSWLRRGLRSNKNTFNDVLQMHQHLVKRHIKGQRGPNKPRTSRRNVIGQRHSSRINRKYNSRCSKEIKRGSDVQEVSSMYFQHPPPNHLLPNSLLHDV